MLIYCLHILYARSEKYYFLPYNISLKTQHSILSLPEYITDKLFRCLLDQITEVLTKCTYAHGEYLEIFKSFNQQLSL